jgi:hypothetical protein
MTRTRRQLLTSAGTALTAGLAGCLPPTARPRIYLDARVREPFDAGPPTRVPVRIVAEVADVLSRDAGFAGVSLECYDARLERVAQRPLGDYTWRAAEPASRTSDDSGEKTRYEARWDRALDVDLEVVPEVVTLSIDALAVEEAPESRSDGLLVGRADALSPPPESAVSGVYYHAERPPSGRVGPSAYEPFEKEVTADLEAIVGDTPMVPPGYFPDRDLAGLDLRLADGEIQQGEETRATVLASFANSGTETISGRAAISSADREVAAVHGTMVTGRGEGTATVEATYLDRTASAKIAVTEREPTTAR